MPNTSPFGQKDHADRLRDLIQEALQNHALYPKSMLTYSQLVVLFLTLSLLAAQKEGEIYFIGQDAQRAIKELGARIKVQSLIPEISRAHNLIIQLCKQSDASIGDSFLHQLTNNVFPASANPTNQAYPAPLDSASIPFASATYSGPSQYSEVETNSESVNETQRDRRNEAIISHQAKNLDVKALKQQFQYYLERLPREKSEWVAWLKNPETPYYGGFCHPEGAYSPAGRVLDLWVHTIKSQLESGSSEFATPHEPGPISFNLEFKDALLLVAVYAIMREALPGALMPMAIIFLSLPVLFLELYKLTAEGVAGNKNRAYTLGLGVLAFSFFSVKSADYFLPDSSMLDSNERNLILTAFMLMGGAISLVFERPIYDADSNDYILIRGDAGFSEESEGDYCDASEACEQLKEEVEKLGYTVPGSERYAREIKFKKQIIEIKNGTLQAASLFRTPPSEVIRNPTKEELKRDGKDLLRRFNPS